MCTYYYYVWYYSLHYNQFEGNNLDFSHSTIPTVSRYEKVGVFRKHVLLVGSTVGIVEWEKSRLFPRIDCTGDCSTLDR